jgi:hypothetical protein
MADQLRIVFMRSQAGAWEREEIIASSGACYRLIYHLNYVYFRFVLTSAKCFIIFVARSALRAAYKKSGILLGRIPHRSFHSWFWRWLWGMYLRKFLFRLLFKFSYRTEFWQQLF